LGIALVGPSAYLKKMLMAIDTAIRAIEEISTISGLILTPSVSSLKKVNRPALDAGIGLPFLLLIEAAVTPTVLKRTGLPEELVVQNGVNLTFFPQVVRPFS